MSDQNKPNGNDKVTTVAQLKELVDKFVAERDWHQFHTPKSVAMSLAVEAAELMEIFTWVHSQDSRAEMERKRREAEDELADVVVTVMCFANSCDIDISSAMVRKLAETAQKYPADKVRGKPDKYTEYKD